MTDSPVPARIVINRAPVLTLWAAIVAERLGHDHDAALTLGRSVAGVNAQSKARTLGPFEKPTAAQQAKRRREEKREQAIEVELLGRIVRAKRTSDGLRALDRGRPANPEAVERYLESKFGDALAAARAAMTQLARSLPPDELAGQAFGLYEQFRPSVAAGKRGWGATGTLDLGLIRAMAKPDGGSRPLRPPGGATSARGTGRARPGTSRGAGVSRARTPGPSRNPGSAAPRARSTRRASSPSRAAAKRRS